MTSAYTIRRPMQGRLDLRGDPVVSSHRTLAGAERMLARQRRGARTQGGYSQDYIVDERAARVVRADAE